MSLPADLNFPHLRSRIIVPLDVSTEREALDVLGLLKGRVGMFKIGLQLFCAEGPGIVRRVVETGERVFLDLKLHDIPRTVGAAAAECRRLGVAMFNVHIGGGSSMVRAARESLAGQSARPLLLGVTVLTSLADEDLASLGIREPLETQVATLARLGQDAGLDGVVASPHEVSAIKKICGDSFLVVTPGVRPSAAARADQKRVMTPREATVAGADYLVIGRPILDASDPVRAVEEIVAEMAG